MPQITPERPPVLLTTTSGESQQQRPASDPAPSRGFGSGGASKSRKRKGGSKRSPALSKADWGPLGKHPDLDAIVARQRLHLPLSGRLSYSQVNQARCAGSAAGPLAQLSASVALARKPAVDDV